MTNLIDLLTPKECEVVKSLCATGDNTAIGVELNIAMPTVKRHMLSIMKKTGLRNRTLVALWAVRNGLDV